MKKLLFIFFLIPIITLAQIQNGKMLCLALNQNSFKKLASSRSLKFPVFKDLLLNGNGILNSSVLVRKSILEDVGLISCDISKITWEDYDCWMRISNKSNRFCYIKETDNTHNSHKTCKYKICPCNSFKSSWHNK